MRKQQALLRDVTYPPPFRRNVHALTGHLPPLDLDRPRVCAFETAQQPQQRCLAAARDSQNRYQRARRHEEIDASQNRCPAKGLGQCGDAEVGIAYCCRSNAAAPERLASSQADRSESKSITASKGAAAAKARLHVFDQTSVARVRVPSGPSNNVDVNSVETKTNTIAAPAPRPGPVSGASTRQRIANHPSPRERADSSSPRGTCAMAARTLTKAYGRNRMP